ncbi:MAG: cell wall-binding repeat-containing protein [Microcella sp.]|uniref:cell wall-binding repeat-containing protein n=1 Tax=Microcella sp. TaxID=1913979 RepID=UPI00271C73AE|nr:cell wall-binding repeat-containing protein [Microcella sp.]MDO8337983.1 cell wall-binding repeat-containing protein [Microcella sp.]
MAAFGMLLPSPANAAISALEPIGAVEPSPSAEPAPSAEPEPSVEPSPSVEPLPSADPEPSAEPEPTAEPSPSDAPEPTEEPESGEAEPESDEAPTPEPPVILEGAAAAAPQPGATVVGGVTVDRISGQDRFDVAVRISEGAFPEGAPIVFLAHGFDFPDALSGAPAAVAHGGPLLLTPSTALPARVESEIVRLAPAKVVILGGEGAVTAAVESRIRALGIAVERVGGADRYVVSRVLASTYFPTAKRAFIATGQNYPDALSGAGVAGRLGAPVILVDGRLTDLDAATRELLTRLGITDATVLGGPGAVSAGIEAGLRSAVPRVDRIGGSDRFAVAEAISKRFMTASDHAFFASGMNFPDALAGAAYAGRLGAPLLLVPQGCPTAGAFVEALDRLSVGRVTIFGGDSVVAPSVEKLRGCSIPSRTESAAQLTKKLLDQMAGLPGRYSITVREHGGMNRSVSIGGSARKEPASVIKLFAAYVVLMRVDQGRISLDTLTRSGVSVGSCLRTMIHISDNLCHADLLALIGNTEINRQLWMSGFRNTFYVGYDGAGNYQSAKKASTDDLAVLLEKLEKGVLLSPSSTSLMKSLMNEQLWRSKIPSGVPAGTRFGNKTGQLWITSGLVEGDAGIVRAPIGTYSVAVLGDQNAANWAIARLSRTVFEHLGDRPIEPATWSSVNLVTTVTANLRNGPGGTVVGTAPTGTRLIADSSNRVWYRVKLNGSWYWVHHTTVATQY